MHYTLAVIFSVMAADGKSLYRIPQFNMVNFGLDESAGRRLTTIGTVWVSIMVISVKKS